MEKNTGEFQYLNILEKILTTGTAKGKDSDILSIFASFMRFDISRFFPLLSTVPLPWDVIVKELLWCISGSTSILDLKKEGIDLWSHYGSRIHLDKHNCTNLPEGDLGPTTGFMWRHYGAKYVDMYTDYRGKGVDQLQKVIREIKHDPTSRRIVMSMWNPTDLPEMPHVPSSNLLQFYVQDGELSSLLYQRGGEFGWMVPYTIASYALLTYMIAHLTDLRPGEFILTTGDVHVYKIKKESLEQRLQKKPSVLPKLLIKRKVTNIDDFQPDDFLLVK